MNILIIFLVQAHYQIYLNWIGSTKQAMMTETNYLRISSSHFNFSYYSKVGVSINNQSKRKKNIL